MRLRLTGDLEKSFGVNKCVLGFEWILTNNFLLLM